MSAALSLTSGLFILDQSGSPTGDLYRALRSVSDAGFQETELFAEGKEWTESSFPKVQILHKALKALDLYPHTIHTPYTELNLASHEPNIRKKSIGLISNALKILGDLGGKTAIVHPTGFAGHNGSQFSRENMERNIENVYESICELIPVAEKAGIRIALENLPFSGMNYRPLVSMQELNSFIADFPAKDIGLCLDTGHAIISGLDPADQAKIASERLYALHIQDVDGKNDSHWVPGTGIINWHALGSALKEINFKGAWTLEVFVCNTKNSTDDIAIQCAKLKHQDIF